MKQLGKILICFCLTLLLVGLSAAVCAAADGEQVTIYLNVQSGQDIAVAFNKASDQARNNPQGRHFVIVVPAGTYTAGSQLRVYSHTTVSMYDATITHTSADSTLVRFGRASADWEQANGGAGHPGYSGFTDITFAGGVLDGGGKKQALLRFGHSTQITLQNMTLRNVQNSHMVEFAGCKDVRIEGCTFEDFRGSWDSTTNYEALQLEVMTTQGGHFNGYQPNDDETPCENVTVTGCTFRNLQRGIGTHTGIAGSYFKNIRFLDNTFTDITGFAIIATNYRDAVISGNTIKNAGCGIIFRTMELSHNNIYTSMRGTKQPDTYVMLNSKIVNNSISVTPGHRALYNPIAYGVQLIGEKLSKKAGQCPKGDFRVAGVTLADNTIHVNASGNGVWMYGAVENTIADNEIVVTLEENLSTAGIRLTKSLRNEISDNTVKLKNKTEATEVYGVQLLDKSTENTFDGNTVSGATKDGFYLEKSNGNTLDSNTISKAGRDGIHLESCSRLLVTGNQIKKSVRNGITANGGKKNAFESNTVTKGQDGLHLETCKQNTISGNVISKVSRDGLLLAAKSNANTVTANKIVAPGRNGISLLQTDKTVLKNNQISGAAQIGLYRENSALKADAGNTISGSGAASRRVYHP